MYEDEIPIGRAENLIGKKYGKLTVLYRVKNIGKLTAWMCECECGTRKPIAALNLKNGHTQSCGCLGAESSRNNLKKALENIRYEDLTNQKFGRLTALYRVENRANQTTWHCICECGNEIDVYAASLKNGKTQSCGCYRKEIAQSKAIDMTGERFGRLLVLERTNLRSGKTVVWKCKCDCGNICYVSRNALQQGKTQSCGCLQKERASATNFKDITGKRFGKLIALYPIDKGECNYSSITWHCQCDCGNTHEVSGSLLRTGKVRSCGCISSYGEECIATICRKHSLQYEQQKTFESCRFKDTGKKARFDFYINQSYLIEFDGVQHFICTDKDWNTLENFEQTQMRDAYKNQWCKDNNIPLIRIPYTKLDSLCIEDLMLETTQFRVV